VIHVKLSFIKVGFCRHPEWIAIRGGSFKSTNFPALVAVIDHPKHGIILFDTGYSDRFFAETRSFPNRFYSMLTPVSLQDFGSAKAQLILKGIYAHDVKHILISHFHADHIAGLRDFPKARFVFLEESFKSVQHTRGLKALSLGFLPNLLPVDFSKRSNPLNWLLRAKSCKEFEPFDYRIDLFDDNSLLVVQLPGHARGQMGIFVRTERKIFFLVADACWKSASYKELRPPHPVTMLLHDNMKEYYQTLLKMHTFWKKRPEVQIVPCHCETLANDITEAQPKFSEGI
jgi:glyoxylase-like metal-dependent hydrolase (beta-lactamase superfamily II)